MRNLIRLRGGRVVRESTRHVLMEWEDVLVTVPMLKGHIPRSTLRSIAGSLEKGGGRRWRYLYT